MMNSVVMHIALPADDSAITHTAGIAQLLERQLAKLNVEGPNPFARFSARKRRSRLRFSLLGRQLIRCVPARRARDAHDDQCCDESRERNRKIDHKRWRPAPTRARWRS
jgi:hypothetical protein